MNDTIKSAIHHYLERWNHRVGSAPSITPPTTLVELNEARTILLDNLFNALFDAIQSTGSDFTTEAINEFTHLKASLLGAHLRAPSIILAHFTEAIDNYQKTIDQKQPYSFRWAQGLKGRLSTRLTEILEAYKLIQTDLDAEYMKEHEIPYLEDQDIIEADKKNKEATDNEDDAQDLSGNSDALNGSDITEAAGPSHSPYLGRLLVQLNSQPIPFSPYSPLIEVFRTFLLGRQPNLAVEEPRPSVRTLSGASYPGVLGTIGPRVSILRSFLVNAHGTPAGSLAPSGPERTDAVDSASSENTEESNTLTTKTNKF